MRTNPDINSPFPMPEVKFSKNKSSRAVANPAPYTNAMPKRKRHPLTPPATKYFTAASKLAAEPLLHAAITYKHTVAHSSAINANIRLFALTNSIIAAVQTIKTAMNSPPRFPPLAKYPNPINPVKSAHTNTNTPKLDAPDSIPPKYVSPEPTVEQKISTNKAAIIPHMAKTGAALFSPRENADKTIVRTANRKRTASAATLFQSNDIFWSSI